MIDRSLRFIDGWWRTAVAILIVSECRDCGAVEASRAKPNILVLLPDDLGGGDISLHGGSVPTPSINRLARAAMVDALDMPSVATWKRWMTRDYTNRPWWSSCPTMGRTRLVATRRGGVARNRSMRGESDFPA